MAVSVFVVRVSSHTLGGFALSRVASAFVAITKSEFDPFGSNFGLLGDSGVTMTTDPFVSLSFFGSLPHANKNAVKKMITAKNKIRLLIAIL